MKTITTKPIANQSSSPHLGFVIDWIDRELGETYQLSDGQGGNTLLELRTTFLDQHLSRMIPRFYRLLPKLEQSHYLLGFRIRTWLSSQFQIRLADPIGRSPAIIFPLSLHPPAAAALRRHFFEHATQAIPLSDIRIEIIPTECHPTNKSVQKTTP